jgi:ABC-type nitrate/sulfonate/bicarbonate transport system substrate-binding protein
MPKNELKDLLKAVEAVRAELHPDLSGDFLSAVIEAEQENLDDEDAAIRAIEAALKRLLTTKGSR